MRQLLSGAGDDLPGGVEENGARGSGALVEG
jgi:hypothetical protein